MDNNSFIRTDINYRSFYEERGLNISGFSTSLGCDLSTRFATLLKISHCSDIYGVLVRAEQGNENAMDIDVCENIEIDGIFGSHDCTGDQVITIKGGCKNVKIKGAIFTPTTRRKAHVQIGNWIDQSYRINSGIDLDLYSPSGTVLVAIGWAIPFLTRLGHGCKYLIWESLKLKAYWITKFCVRIIMGIKKGRKGPSWM